MVGLHGVPTSPVLWSRLRFPVIAPDLLAEVPDDWSLEHAVRRVLPLITPDSVLIGHDLGGVVAAMVAAQVRVRTLVLSGTALGPYWAPVRLTAWPPFDRYFYDRYGGRRFLAGSVGPAERERVLAAFPADPGLADRMRRIARAMRPPPGLATALRGTSVRLVWGRHDRWYPPLVARAIAHASGAEIRWIDAGHLCMWEAPEAFTQALAD